MIRLILKTEPVVPLEADTIAPDRFLGKTAAEIGDLFLLHGNEMVPLGDFFSIFGDSSAEITIEGDLRRVKWIGARMTQGRITIYGDVGMHLGSGMRGGEIVVHGNVDNWAGAEMAGGLIHIRGNAGHGLGGAYRGSPQGMNRGIIVVTGNAGNEVGAAMRRGVIAVGGEIGEFAGAFMIAGNIFVFGRLGARAGAGMKWGSIVALGEVAEILPTFRYSCCYQPVFLRPYLRALAGFGLPVTEAHLTGYYHRYCGDLTSLGKGEILIHDQR